jgi:hypothetical protein
MTTAEIIAAYERLREEHKIAAAEGRACGIEVAPFDEWSGRRNLKDEKMAEWQRRWDNDTQDLY